MREVVAVATSADALDDIRTERSMWALAMSEEAFETFVAGQLEELNDDIDDEQWQREGC